MNAVSVTFAFNNSEEIWDWRTKIKSEESQRAGKVGRGKVEQRLDEKKCANKMPRSSGAMKIAKERC
jgi:hypothetical protein